MCLCVVYFVGVLEYCQSEHFRPACAANEVVVMMGARYGRLRIGRCVSEDFGYLGCVHDVMVDLDGACSGRRQCDIRIDETTFLVVQPCHKDLKSYLEATYECLKGNTYQDLRSISLLNGELMLLSFLHYLA